MPLAFHGKAYLHGVSRWLEAVSIARIPPVPARSCCRHTYAKGGEADQSTKSGPHAIECIHERVAYLLYHHVF